MVLIRSCLLTAEMSGGLWNNAPIIWSITCINTTTSQYCGEQKQKINNYYGYYVKPLRNSLCDKLIRHYL